VQEFFQDRDGVMWFGCSGGLFFLDGEALVHVTKAGPWPEAGAGAGSSAFDELREPN